MTASRTFCGRTRIPAQISIWEMHGNTLVGGGQVRPNPGTAWQAIGTGDFNQDGFADILLQNTNTGAVSVWEMNGNSLIGGGQVGQSRTELARDRSRRRRLRHPAAKHERASHDLGDEWKHHRRRRACQPQSRDDLACDCADLSQGKSRLWLRRPRPRSTRQNNDASSVSSGAMSNHDEGSRCSPTGHAIKDLALKLSRAPRDWAAGARAEARLKNTATLLLPALLCIC